MRFCSLSSSSQHGNAFLIQAPGGATVLVDCGVRIRRLEACLQGLGVNPATIRGLFMTHDHADHVAALQLAKPFASKYQIPVHATAGFWAAWDPHGRRVPAPLRRTVRSGTPVQVDSDLALTPFSKPHDAPEPVSYVAEGAGCRVAVVTDLGHVPGAFYDLLSGCDGYVFEANHDREMELNSGRNPALVYRVLGSHGHLSNEQAAEALARLVDRRTRAVLLAHLSPDCNTPDLARETVARRLRGAGWTGCLDVAPLNAPSGWISAGPAQPAGAQLRLSSL